MACQSHQKSLQGDTSCMWNSFTSDDYCVAASCLNSEQVTCTLVFSPSKEIRDKENVKTSLSRRLTKLLRHEAASRRLPMGCDGYVRISSVLSLPEYRQFSLSDVLYVVKCDSKKRYSLRVENSVSSNIRRATSSKTYKESDCMTSRVDSVNPLFDEGSQPTEEARRGRFHLTAAPSKNEQCPQATNNLLKRSPSQTIRVVSRKCMRDNSRVEEASHIVAVWYRHSERLSSDPDTPHISCLVQRTGSDTASLQRKTEGARTSAGCASASCGRKELKDGTTQASSITLRRRSVGPDHCGEQLLHPEYVDATRVSIRAVQGHSLAFVDSERLLRRVSTVEDLIESVTCSIVQSRAPSLSTSATLESSSCISYQSEAINPRVSAQASKPAASAPSAGICVVHGTYWRNWEIIRKTGLRRMSRNHIHFATRLPEEGDVISGMRSNVEVLIFLDVERVLAAGLCLYVSKNGVVLSPGNEEGIIECKFFEKVVDRKTGKCLALDEDG